MTRDLNKVMVIGNVGRAPEMRYMPDGRPVTCFSVGTARTWTDSEGKRCEQTEWFNVVVWDELAEVCKERLGRDYRVYLEGRLQTRSWEGHDGRQRLRTELVANEMILLSDADGAA